MKNIVLIGFMGTGKTCTGRLLANRLGRPFIDTDQKLELDAQMTIADMFARYGEAYFRDRESEAIEWASRFRGAVVSTGGGAVLRPANMEKLRRSGVLISLTADAEVVLRRTGRKKERPLLDGPGRRLRVADLMRRRSRLYEDADLRLDTSVDAPPQLVDKIIAFLRQGGHLCD